MHSTLPSAIGILVNRNNQYSSTFEFAVITSSESKIKTMVILVPTERSAMIANTQKMMFEYFLRPKPSYPMATVLSEQLVKSTQIT